MIKFNKILYIKAQKILLQNNKHYWKDSKDICEYLLDM